MIEISRRAFLGGLASAAVAIPASGAASPVKEMTAAEASSLPHPNQAQLIWQNCELGVLYSLDLPVFVPDWNDDTFRTTLDPRLFDPKDLNTDQWLEAAKTMGAKYAIFTATHQNGFLQWQSDLYPYGLKQAKWRNGKGDLVKDFVESCYKYGIKPGFFMSCYGNAYWKVTDFRVNWGKGGKEQAAFNHICERMVEELCSRYGPLVEMWFDGGLLSPEEGGPDLLPIVKKYQPDAVFYHSAQLAQHRWIGNELGLAGDPCWATMPNPSTVEAAYRGGAVGLLPHGDPDGKHWSPGMCDVPIRNHDWFWRPNAEQKLSPLSFLIEKYYTSAGRNCNYILGAVPGPDGLIPEGDFRRFGELGDEIRRRFAKPLAETQGHGTTIDLTFSGPTRINHLILMEDIAYGERIREYEVEGLATGNRWQRICAGSSVGHKWIQNFNPLEVTRIRFRCIRSRATPRLLKLAAYDVQNI